MTLEERLENPYLKAKREARAEGKAEGMVEGVIKVAENLLKAGVSKDVIYHATGLTIADLEKQSRTGSLSASPSVGS